MSARSPGFVSIPFLSSFFVATRGRYLIFSNARTNASFPTRTDPRNGRLISAVASNANAINSEKNTTCTPCKNRFCDPNMHDEIMTNTPPIISTNHNTAGSDNAFSSNRVRRQVVIVLSSVSA